MPEYISRRLSEHVRSRLSDEPDVIGAMFVGSTVEGFANTSSDLDLLVVRSRSLDSVLGESIVAEGRSGPTIGMAYIDDVRVDEEVWPWSYMRPLVLSLAQIRSLDDLSTSAVTGYTFDDLELLHGLRRGHLIRASDEFAEMRSLIGQGTLCGLVARHALLTYTSVAEDAAGALKSGDFRTAWITSQTTLDAAVDALIAASGDSSPKRKWRFRKLARASLTEVEREYMALTATPATDDTSLAHTTKARLRAASRWAAESHDRLRRSFENRDS